MSRVHSPRLSWRLGLKIALISALLPPFVFADKLTLKNGLEYEGKLGKAAEIGEDSTKPASAGGVKVTNIVFVDNDLSRLFVSSRAVRTISNEAVNLTKIPIDKRTAGGNKRIGGVGPIIRVTPFDEFGNRIYSFSTPTGRLDIVQGITEITPLYTRVEGLAVRTNQVVWDMRIATSSIPRDTLSAVLLNHIDPTESNDRLKIVQLYVESDRYRDAEAELDKVIKDFPQLKSLERQHAQLTQRAADQTIKEIERRRDSGQYEWTQYLLENFKSEGVAGETLLKVKDIADEYHRKETLTEDVIALLDKHIGELTNNETKQHAQTLRDEIKNELGINTLNRMADYLRLGNDDSMKVEQKLSLGISGWLVGSGNVTQNLAVSLSLHEVRDLVRDYLRTKSHEVAAREALLAQMREREGGSPQYVAQLVANMKPALDMPERHAKIPNLFDVTIPGIKDHPQFSYMVQLPPEYDPYRRYPCIVSLHGAGSTAESQLEWWAGPHSEKLNMRTGQAARHSYIVITPRWKKRYQRKYEYGGREHAAVLFALRDACRHFSVDTDRVFLSGHSMGADAAWDIGLAHPDLFAGLICVAGKADKYIPHYAENGRKLPMYFVSGDLDGNKITLNKDAWNKYLKYSGYDCTVALYKGRGHEHFHDEVQRMFDWMRVHERNFFADEFECQSMRQWDNFFYWLEVDGLPSQSMVAPASWPRKGARAASIKAKFVKSSNVVIVTSGAEKTTVWLAPEMVDFDKPVTATINRRRVRSNIEAETKTLLEDVRTRGDRQHPFWAKIEK